MKAYVGHAICFAILSAMVLCSISAYGQRNGRSFEKGVITIVNKHDTDSADYAEYVERAFRMNSPQSPKENNLPRFAIVGKERLFYLGIGAQFLGEAVFDWGDELPSPLSFAPSQITQRLPGDGGNFRFAWQSSSFHLNFVALPDTHHQIGLYLKAEFNINGSMKCSYFYARYSGLTLGYTNSIFMDGAAQPFTIDNQGPNALPNITLFTAFWTQKFGKGLSGAIGVDASSVDCTDSDIVRQTKQRIPAFPLYLQYAYNNDENHVRLSGIVRPMQYRNIQHIRNKALIGMGIQLSGLTHIYGPISFTYNAVYGHGIASYLHDDADLGLDATPSLTEGKMSLTRNLGLTASLEFDFSSRVSSNIVFSHLFNWLGKDATPQPDFYRQGSYLAANIIYNVNRFVSAGIEYDYGHSKRFNGKTLHANRLQVQATLTF